MPLWVLIVLCLAGACLTGITFWVLAVVPIGEPYRMILRPTGGRAVVQFLQPDRDVKSPEFPVNLAVDRSFEIVLNGDVAIPGGEIEFSDTTFLPGRFKIRIGDTLFDVMEYRIVVNGTDIRWDGVGK
jgi:hypothetical protein